VLIDDCLMEVFQRLPLVDYANLAFTCHRIRDVARVFSELKHKKIVIEAWSRDSKYSTISKLELRKVLSVVGEHVVNVEVTRCNPFILKSIQMKCEKLASVSVHELYATITLEGFRNLKNFKLEINRRIGINEWKNFFEANTELEVLDNNCQCDYRGEGYFELLIKLPKLQSLRLPFIRDSFHRSADFQHLLRLTGLTKLRLWSLDNLNGILIDLAKCIKLVELDIFMEFNDESLAAIKSFENLEVLSIHPWRGWKQAWFTNASVLPPKLQRLEMKCIDISCSQFLELLQHLPDLKEFDIVYGEIRWDDSGKLFHPNNMLQTSKPLHLFLVSAINYEVSQTLVAKAIENVLISNRRTLKIRRYVDGENSLVSQI